MENGFGLCRAQNPNSVVCVVISTSDAQTRRFRRSLRRTGIVRYMFIVPPSTDQAYSWALRFAYNSGDRYILVCRDNAEFVVSGKDASLVRHQRVRNWDALFLGVSGVRPNTLHPHAHRLLRFDSCGGAIEGDFAVLFRRKYVPNLLDALGSHRWDDVGTIISTNLRCAVCVPFIAMPAGSGALLDRVHHAERVCKARLFGWEMQENGKFYDTVQKRTHDAALQPADVYACYLGLKHRLDPRVTADREPESRS